MPAEAELPPERYVRRLRAVERRRGIGSLLEVGPGSGAFLNYARSVGWQVVGIETSQYAAQQASARYGLDIRCGTLGTVDLGGRQFDVVHMSHVLEHLSDPIASLHVVHGLLKPRGSLIIEVPHEFGSLQFRVLKAARLLKPYQVSCTHILFFTPSTLCALLERTGFTPSGVSTIRDLGDRPGFRQLLRRIAGALERPLNLAPLIEAVAVKSA